MRLLSSISQNLLGMNIKQSHNLIKMMKRIVELLLNSILFVIKIPLYNCFIFTAFGNSYNILKKIIVLLF